MIEGDRQVSHAATFLDGQPYSSILLLSDFFILSLHSKKQSFEFHDVAIKSLAGMKDHFRIVRIFCGLICESQLGYQLPDVACASRLTYDCRAVGRFDSTSTVLGLHYVNV